MRKDGQARLAKIKGYLQVFGCARREVLGGLFFPSLHRSQVVLSEWVEKKQLGRSRVGQYVYHLPGCKVDPETSLLLSDFDYACIGLDGVTVGRELWEGSVVYRFRVAGREFRVIPYIKESDLKRLKISLPRYPQNPKPTPVKLPTDPETILRNYGS